MRGTYAFGSAGRRVGVGTGVGMTRTGLGVGLGDVGVRLGGGLAELELGVAEGALIGAWLKAGSASEPEQPAVDRLSTSAIGNNRPHRPRFPMLAPSPTEPRSSA